MTALNSTQGSALIREKTGRPCTRQNLEAHCKAGRLPESCLSLKPIRIDSEKVVDEFVAMVSPAQIHARQPRAQLAPIENRPQHPPPRPRQVEELPDYNISRARSEYEKANLLELDRKQKEALLLPAEQVEKVWANAITIARTKLLAVPTRARQQIPHLTLEEVAIVEELIRESLEELASGK